MSEFIAPSGAKVVINVASFEEAMRLKKAIERAVGSAPTFASPLQMMLLVDSNDDVEKALWGCLARCLREGEKIIPATFDPPDARADYYEIGAACVKENLGPLLESLRSKLSEHGITIPQAEKTEKNPESKSPTKAS